VLVGILLAGGQSSRMGTDKALLTLDGQTQLERSRSLLQQAGCQHVIISRAGHTEDLHKDSGPLAGIYAGIHAASKLKENVSGFLILPVDMPCLPVISLQKLAQSDTTLHYENSALPCFIPNSSHLEKLLEQRLHKKQLRITELLTALNAQAVPSTNEKWLINTNTPDEWSQLLNHS
jgi:molybdopterin-guanine dinucleotide biosynthesis protein A